MCWYSDMNEEDFPVRRATTEEWRAAYEAKVEDFAAETRRTTRLSAALTEIASRHTRLDMQDDSSFCSSCTTSWPCQTRKIADAALEGSLGTVE